MANTHRESTVHQRSENASHAAGSRPVPALGFGPHISNAVDAICQAGNMVTLPARGPLISRIAEAAKTVFALHTESNGATVSVIDGNMAGRKLYAVSMYPELTYELKAPPSRRLLLAYALTNMAVLVQPGRALGTWFNKPKGHVLDLVMCCPDRAVAIALGRRFHQSCIYDLAAGREIHISRPARPLRPAHARGRNV
jgi:hypothetical protein